MHAHQDTAYVAYNAQYMPARGGEDREDPERYSQPKNPLHDSSKDQKSSPWMSKAHHDLHRPPALLSSSTTTSALRLSTD
jgi:hypothetical protein